MNAPLPIVMRTIDRLSLAGTRLQGARSRYVDTQQGRVHMLDVAGQGSLPPMVLFHGLGSCGADYSTVFRPFRKICRRLLVPDLPGHGGSQFPPGGMDPLVIEEALLAALDDVLDEPAILFGNSMGGMVAVRYARARPDKVAALVLASPGGTPIESDQMQAFWSRFDLRTHRQAVSFVKDRYLGRPSRLSHVVAYALRYRLSLPVTLDLLDRVAPEHLLTPDDLRCITAPTLLFWGQEDRVLPAEHLAFFREHLPDHTVFDTPARFGHAPFMDDAPGFADTVRRFVEGALG